jgi:ABC-2 type transport system permease protein
MSSVSDNPAHVAAPLKTTRPFAWSVRREIWEHRALWIAPSAAAGLVLFAFVVRIVKLPALLDKVSHLPPMEHAAAIGAPFAISAIAIMLTGVVVSVFYCLSALNNERRDRSILFWKSLPISNRDTVLSKVISATLVAPTIACVFGTFAGFVLLLLAAFTASLHGLNMWQLLMNSHPLVVAVNLITLIPLYVIWALPTVGWLMFCSAWTRSKPFLWALLAPLAAGVIVSWFGLMGLFNLSAGWFWKNVVARMLLSVIPGGWIRDTTPINNEPSDPSILLNHIGLAHNYAALASPDLWIGAIAGIVLIIAAIWFRRWRDDS